MKVRAWLWGQRYILLCAVLGMFFHKGLCVCAQDLTVVGTPQQANDRIKTLSTAAKSGAHDYTIGNGDLIEIAVFDVPELSRDVRVSQSGTISLPLVPTRLHIAGLSESQSEQLIEDVLQANGLVSHPEVSVSVKEHRSRPITIVGAVQHPMVYEADNNVTLLEALAEAGGVANDAGDTVIVTRPHTPNFVMIPYPEPISSTAPGAASSDTQAGQTAPAPEDKWTPPDPTAPVFPTPADTTQPPVPTAEPKGQSPTNGPPGNVITINLNDLLETGDMSNNIPLQAGDVVTVPHAGIVYVLGAVSRPGGFVLSNDRTQMTALKVLALAGGFTNIAKKDHAVIIRRNDQGKQTETEVDLKKVIKREAEDVQMRASDILYVPDSRTKQALLQAAQLGIAVGTAVAIYRIAYQ